MDDVQKRKLKTALRIISKGGEVNPSTVDLDLRDYYASAPQRGISVLDAAIEAVVDAIETAAKPPAFMV